tara:strand:+ start:127 stop:444 length:318 start_codon:yes stop_codon:yes gene_type:complete
MIDAVLRHACARAQPAAGDEVDDVVAAAAVAADLAAAGVAAAGVAAAGVAGVAGLAAAGIANESYRLCSSRRIRRAHHICVKPRIDRRIDFGSAQNKVIIRGGGV